MTRQESIRAIHTHLLYLGDIEIEIIAAIADRLAMGQKQYGKFPADDKRDFLQEAKEEALDLAVYMARRCIR